MATYLNQELGFDEVRWATLRKTSYDSRGAFQSAPDKQLLPLGSRLFRLVPMTNGRYFEGFWWMPQSVFEQLHTDANRAAHGGGRMFRNYIAQYMALPPGANQLSVVEIELTQPVYGWVGNSAPLFDRPGGMEQIYLPNLADRGQPRFSIYARLVRTYWLKF